MRFTKMDFTNQNSMDKSFVKIETSKKTIIAISAESFSRNEAFLCTYAIVYENNMETCAVYL